MRKRLSRNIAAGRFWWTLSALLFVLMLVGSLGIHRHLASLPLLIAPDNAMRSLIKEEIALRKEISTLRMRITQEKRRCLLSNCGSGRSADGTPPTPRTDTPDRMPEQNGHPALVFVMDCSETMGLHVNTGPNVEKPLLEGLRKGSQDARWQLQDYLGRTTDRRIDRVRHALIDVLEKIPAAVPVGLVSTRECDRIDAVPPAAARDGILQALRAAVHQGHKPLAAAVERGLALLGPQRSHGVLIIITDGADTCGNDLCRTMQGLQSGAVPREVHLVNMGRTADFKCLSQAPFGTVHQPMGPKSLAPVLARIVASTFPRESETSPSTE